jgi:hypothetical protein
MTATPTAAPRRRGTYHPGRGGRAVSPHNVAAALAIAARWACPKPPPPGWLVCRRCGEPSPAEVRYWAPRRRRLCRGCASDEAHGVWPFPRVWCAKNRWTVDGHLERRCAVCQRWLPVTAYPINRSRRATGASALQLHSQCRACNTAAQRRRQRARREAARAVPQPSMRIPA